MNLKTNPTIIATTALLFGGFARAPLPSVRLLAGGAAEASPVDVQQSPTAADLQRLEWDLARDQPLESGESLRALIAIRAAGVSDDPSTVPALWSLADRLSEGSAQLLALEALDALWRLGEPASKFESRLDLLHTKPNLAKYAGLVLGRSLLPEHLAKIEAAAKAAKVARLQQAQFLFWAVRQARSAARIAESYERASSLQARVDAVAPFSLGSFSLAVRECSSLQSSLATADPVTFIARARLYELSASEPIATVKALLASNMGGVPTADEVPDEARRETIFNSFRDHAALHLTPAAKAMYKDHRPQALFDHPLCR